MNYTLLIRYIIRSVKKKSLKSLFFHISKCCFVLPNDYIIIFSGVTSFTTPFFPIKYVAGRRKPFQERTSCEDRIYYIIYTTIITRRLSFCLCETRCDNDDDDKSASTRLNDSAPAVSVAGRKGAAAAETKCVTVRSERRRRKRRNKIPGDK